MRLPPEWIEGDAPDALARLSIWHEEARELGVLVRREPWHDVITYACLECGVAAVYDTSCGDRVALVGVRDRGQLRVGRLAAPRHCFAALGGLELLTEIVERGGLDGARTWRVASPVAEAVE